VIRDGTSDDAAADDNDTCMCGYGHARVQDTRRRAAMRRRYGISLRGGWKAC
jgi:hypothetical protein